MIIADTNLVAYLIIPGPLTADAERVRAKDRSWTAPSLLRCELLNVVVKYMRQNSIDRDSALRLYRRGRALVQTDDLPSDPLAILNMFEASQCSPYDLEFVWFAMEKGVPLVT